MKFRAITKKTNHYKVEKMKENAKIVNGCFGKFLWRGSET